MSYLRIRKMDQCIEPIMRDIVGWFDTHHIVVPDDKLVYTKKYYDIALDYLEQWTKQYAKSNTRGRVLQSIAMSRKGPLDIRRIRTIYNTWYNVCSARVDKGLDV